MSSHFAPRQFADYALSRFEALLVFSVAVAEIFIFPIPLALHRVYELWMVSVPCPDRSFDEQCEERASPLAVREPDFARSLHTICNIPRGRFGTRHSSTQDESATGSILVHAPANTLPTLDPLQHI